MSEQMSEQNGNYKYLLSDRRDAVGLITFNRPEAMNALCIGLLEELAQVLALYDGDDAIRAIVITGNEKAFAAGADITEMQESSFQQMLSDNGQTKHCDAIAECKTPVIAAVAGYALGGGCELAMMCDFIIAADNAQFGQPEVTIGTIPGFGGSQRLTRLVGKSKAMDMCLTGRMMDAAEAERSGLVSQVVSVDDYLQVSLKAAAKIASFSSPVIAMAKTMVDSALETGLTQGIKIERRLFKSTFALEDQKEGMTAFVEKRKPAFKHR